MFHALNLPTSRRCLDGSNCENAARHFGKIKVSDSASDARLKITKDDCMCNYWDMDLMEIFSFYRLTKTLDGIFKIGPADLDEIDNLLIEGLEVLKIEEQYAR